MEDINREFESIEAVFQNDDIGATLEVLKKKADDGDAKSQFLVGHGTFMKFYMDNYGGNVRGIADEVNGEVISWMTKSANQGYTLAQLSLSEIYRDEDRCEEVDKVKGLMWAIIGTLNSSENNPINSYMEENGISDEEVKKAEVLAREWQSSNLK